MESESAKSCKTPTVNLALPVIHTINSSVPIGVYEIVLKAAKSNTLSVSKSSFTEQVRSSLTAAVDTVDSAVLTSTEPTPHRGSVQGSVTNQFGELPAVWLADDERTLNCVKWNKNRCTAQWRKVKHK